MTIVPVGTCRKGSRPGGRGTVRPVRRGLRIRLGALALASLGAPSCDSKRTEVVVVLDTDVPRTDMDGYRILVFGSEDLSAGAPEENAVTDRAFPILDEPPFQLPASFGVAPRDGDADRMVRIVAQGRLTALESVDNPFGEMGIETSAVTGFLEGEVRQLDLVLAAGCAGVECSAGLTCAENGCIDERVEVGRLPPWPPATD